MKIKKLFQKSQKITHNFKIINSDLIRDNPEILKIIRLSLKMSVAEFSRKFKMHQQSRYERKITIPNTKTISRFLEIFQKYKDKCNFNLNTLIETDKIFLEKRKAGILVGKKTLFTENDRRTRELSKLGAQKGGLTTLKKYGYNHMCTLAKQIQRGRKENFGFRSKSELLVAKTLDELGIEYQYEKPVNGYLPDFNINDKILIEVMCFATNEYWKKQKIKIKKLIKDFKIIIITNNPNQFCNKKDINVIKFSKSVNILKNRINEKINFS